MLLQSRYCLCFQLYTCIPTSMPHPETVLEIVFEKSLFQMRLSEEDFFILGKWKISMGPNQVSMVSVSLTFVSVAIGYFTRHAVREGTSPWCKMHISHMFYLFFGEFTAIKVPKLKNRIVDSLSSRDIFVLDNFDVREQIGMDLILNFDSHTSFSLKDRKLFHTILAFCFWIILEDLRLISNHYFIK